MYWKMTASACRRVGQREAVRCMRGRISRYGKTMGHVKPLKDAVRLAESVFRSFAN